MDADAEPLDPADLDPDPIVQFRRWYDDAVQRGVRQPDAMTLSTTGLDGAPDARVVLLRALDERGIAFYTNLESVKARQLHADARVAAVFHWRELERQIRIRGSVERVPDEEAVSYWEKRPRGHRIGAWSSPQSEVIDSDTLARRLIKIEAQYVVDEPPLPPFWGGYVVGVDELELWQGRTNRLHDRVRYRRVGGDWVRERLAP